jgi:hypothetical protein
MPVRTSHSTTGHDTSAFMYTYGRFRVVEISAVGREQPFERGPLTAKSGSSGLRRKPVISRPGVVWNRVSAVPELRLRCRPSP